MTFFLENMAKQEPSLFINRFLTGLVTQRNPLVTPYSLIGLNIVQRNDALIDGLNVEISNSHTLQRRPGFPRYCSQQLASNEAPVNIDSFRNLSGTVFPLLDTNLAVYQFSTSAITSIFTKGTTAETFFLTVGSAVFMSNGVDAQRWTGSGGSTNWGIAPPGAAPTLAFAAGSLSPQVGYMYVSVYQDANLHPSTASPFSAFTGALTSQQITVSGLGSADPQVTTIGIYRIADGGSAFYQAGTVANPGGGNAWNFVDNVADGSLNTQLIAPLAHANDPPPTGATVSEFHMGRVWVAVGNQIQFSAGPDTINGDGQRSFPPANIFTFRGQVFKMVSTTQGLLVFTSSTLYAILGTSTLSFYSVTVMNNFGVISANAVTSDGDRIFVYTIKKQLLDIQVGTQQSEIGFTIGNLLETNFAPQSVYLTIHRSGRDSGIWISDGSTNIFYYSLNNNCWSTTYQLAGAGGVKVLRSIETTAGNFTLMAGRASNNGFLLGRSLTVFHDDASSTYTPFATIGSLRTSQLGDPLTEKHAIAYERMPVGSDFTIDVLLNDISGSFVNLPQTTREPYELTAPAGQTGAPSTGVIAWRHDFSGAQSQTPYAITHMQIRITMANEDAKSELLGLAIVPPKI